MKVPKKIYPDNIQDSFVEIKYTSDLPLVILIGIIYKALDDSYTFTIKPLSINGTQTEIPEGFPFEVSGQNIFFNEKITILFINNSIIFNCLDQYISWSYFFPEIKNAFSQIINSGVINTITSIGLRYVSKYSGADLRESINFNFSFGMPEIASKSYSFNSQFGYKGENVNLNLHHMVKYISNKGIVNTNVSDKVSLIDIDVISADTNIESKDSLKVFSKIDLLHTIEKEIFFGLLKPDFLETLKPEYDGDI